MSQFLDNFEKLREIPENIKKQIKYFYVFNDYNNYKSRTNILLITFDERVFGFGSNFRGVLGFGHQNSVNEVTEIPELKGNNIKEFYNGFNFVIGVNGENKCFIWMGRE